MEIDLVLCQSIQQKIATFDRAEILEAVRLTESFPAPGDEPADVLSQVMHDVALHVESLGEWDLSAAIYKRALEYRVNGAHITIGNWYRLGICQERIGCLWDAIGTFRRALGCGEAWPHVTALVRQRLAGLLIAAEEYREAATVLMELVASLPHPDISAQEVEVSLARCLIRTNRPEEARQRLELFCNLPGASESAAEGLHLLADLYEMSGNRSGAMLCYQRIIASGAAETRLKEAAAYRLATLQSSR